MAGQSIEDGRQYMANEVRRQFSQQGVPPAMIERMCAGIIAGTHGQVIREQLGANGAASSSDISDTGPGAAATLPNEQQSQEMVKQQKQRLAYISTWAGKPRPRKRSEEVLRGHDSNPRVPDRNHQEMFFVVIPAFYPPCMKALRDLEAVSLTKLHTESHHPGKALLAQLLGLYTVGNSSFYGAIRDMDGEYEEVKIPTFCLGYDRSWPREPTWIAIKEPYLTIDESMSQSIMVTHPSDLVFVDRIPRGLRPLRLLLNAEQNASDYPLKCKQRGDELLKSNDFVSAAVKYSQGLDHLNSADTLTGELTSLKADLHRNRALACLSLRRFEEALTDAMASLSLAKDGASAAQEARALSRAGRAAYGLRRYEEAATYFTRQADKVTASESAECEKWLGRATARISEQATGTYDFAALMMVPNTNQPRLDIADFTSNVEIKTAGPHRGRGLFATRNIAFGQLILVEKAFCATWHHEKEALLAYKFYVQDPNTPAIGMLGLWKETMQYARNNPSEAARLLTLHSDYAGTGKEVVTVDGTVALDSFQVHDIVKQNAFGLHGFPEVASGPGDHSSGLFITASFFNHSCLANANRSFMGDMIVVSASKPIAKGDEITLGYTSDAEFTRRADVLQVVWSFSCTCSLCAAEKADSTEVRNERMRLESEAKTFVARFELSTRPVNHFTPAIISAADQLLSRILATYDEERYASLPRHAALSMSHWLVEVAWSNHHNNLGSLHERIEKHYQLLGYTVIMRLGRVADIVPTANSLVPEDLVSCGLVPVYHAIQTASNDHARRRLTAFANGLSMAKFGTTELVDIFLNGGA